MKRKIAIIADGWRRHITYVWIRGCRNYIKEHELDIEISVFHSFGNFSRDEKFNAGEYNIIHLPDLSQFDGIILEVTNMLNQKKRQQIIRIIQESGVPAVSLLEKIPGLYHAGLDNYATMEQMVEHLIVAHSCKTLNYVGGPADSQENLIGNIAVLLGNHQVTIKPDIDGEPRDIEMEVVLDLDLKAYHEFKMPLLKDMYANNRKLKLKTSPIQFENLIFQNNAKTKVSQRVEAVAGEIHKLLQVLNVEGNVRIEDFHFTKQGIATEGLIFCNVLYIAGDDTAPIQSKEVVIPFEYLVEIPEVMESDRCEIRGVLEQIGGYVVDSNELEIRAVAGIYVTGFSPQTMYMIDEVEEIPYTEEEISKIPSITGYIVKEGDTLWNIAKHYGTTIEKMKQYNENLTEPLESGQKIFLLKEMENLVI